MAQTVVVFVTGAENADELQRQVTISTEAQEPPTGLGAGLLIGAGLLALVVLGMPAFLPEEEAPAATSPRRRQRRR